MGDKRDLETLRRYPELYRVKLGCRNGRDALERKVASPGGVTPLEYAVFHLLHAVEDLATVLEKMQQGGGPA